jgi:hypothetical protein
MHHELLCQEFYTSTKLGASQEGKNMDGLFLEQDADWIGRIG